MIITGYFVLSNAIQLKANCLNQIFEININGFHGKLFTPILPDDFKENKEESRRLLIQPASDINFNETIEWGQPYSWPSGDSNISRFKIEIELSEDLNLNDVKEEILAKTEMWINRFEENFFAFGHHINLSNIKVMNNNYQNFDLYYRKGVDKKPEHIQSEETQRVIVTIKDAIEFEAFKGIVIKTSQNKRLSPEYVFLKESQYSLNKNDYRKSILDSATALEICLTNILKEVLEIGNENLLVKILKMNNSISKKRLLLKTIPFELPDYNYTRDVEDLRNRAIHAGIEIEEEDAKTAYNIVSKTLDSLITERLV